MYYHYYFSDFVLSARDKPTFFSGLLVRDYIIREHKLVNQVKQLLASH